MAQQIINVGSQPDNGDGDPLRTAFIKTNENFTEIYQAGPVGSNIQIANNTISTSQLNGNIILAPRGIGVVQTNSTVMPRLDNVYDLGTPSARYNTLYLGTGGFDSVGNITGNYFIGNGSLLTGIVAEAPRALIWGNTNLSIANVNGNITLTVTGTNVVTVTPSGLNLNGNINVSQSLVATDVQANTVTASSLVSTPLLTVSTISAANGTANIGNVNAVTVNTTNLTASNTVSSLTVLATGNITGNILKTGNVTVSDSTITAAGNITASYFLGNFAGNISGNLTVPGSNTGVVFNDSGLANSSNGFTFDKSTNAAVVSGNLSAANLIASANLSAVSLNASGVASVTGNITGGNLITAGVLSASGNVGGANFNTTGVVSALGNVSGANINTTGLVSALGNVTGSNLNTVGVVSATGNITGGNLNTVGVVSATGNITGGNITTAGTANLGTLIVANTSSFAGNVTSNLNITGNVAAGNISTPGQVAATGAITSSSNISGANINTTGVVSATGNVSGGNINTTGQVVATGNVSGANINTTGKVTANSIDVAGNLLVGGILTVTSDAQIDGNLSVNGNLVYVNVEDLNVEDPIIALGRGVNNTPLTNNDGKDRGTQLWYYSGSEKSAFFGYDNSSGNLLLAKDVSITGEIVTVNNFGNVEAGNLSIQTATATGNVSAGNVITAAQFGWTGTGSNSRITNNGSISLIPDTGYDALSGVQIGGSGYLLGPNGSRNLTLNYNNENGLAGAYRLAVTGNQPQAIVNFGTNATGSIGNATSYFGNAFVKNVTTENVTASGNVNANNVLATAATFTGNVTAHTFIGNIQGNIDAGGANTQIQFNDNDVLAGSAAFTFDKSSNVVTASGNIIGGNITTAGTANLGTLAVTGTTSFTGNITSNVNVTGNIASGNITTPGLITASSNITGGNLITAGIVSATGNITSSANISGNFVAAGANRQVMFNDNGLISSSALFTFDKAGPTISLTNAAGTLITGYVSSLGGSDLNLTPATNNLVIWGSANPRFSNTYTLGTSTFQWRNVWAGNANIGAMSVSGPVTFAQTLTVTGNLSGGNIATAGLINANGTVTGGNLVSNAVITATGNVTGGNLITAGLIDATGSITSAANISGNNISATQLITATSANISGNVNAGNVSSTGQLIATGNITGGNLITAGLANVTGNIYGNNIIAAANVEILGNKITTGTTTGLLFEPGNVSLISGNIIVNGGYIYSQNGDTAIVLVNNGEIGSVGIENNLQVGKDGQGNLDVAGYANVTSNLTVGGAVTATSNVTGGNLNTAGQVVATGNVTGGNLITSGQVVATGNINTTANVIAANIVTANINSSTGIVITTSGNNNIELNPGGTGNIVLDNNYINSVANPIQDQDAATKIYVDNLVSTAISYHEAVVAATTANLATTTGGTITYSQPNGAGNGVGATITTTGSFNLIDTANVQTANTRILVKDEANAVLNGVYVWSNATVITRSSDTDTYGVASANTLAINDYFYVSSGNVNKGSAYIVDSPTGVITFGTSNIAFAQFSSTQVYTGGNGINVAGTIITAKVDNDTTAFDGTGNIVVKASANLTTPNIGAATGTSLIVNGNITANNISANSFLAATTINATGNITGGNINSNGLANIAGTVATGNLTVTGFANISGNLSAIGNVRVGQDLSFSAAYANLQYAGSANNYVQLVAQNKDNGSAASTDFVATADNGTDNDTYIDMGINSSGYNQPAFALQGVNDGYLYVAGNTTTGGGNLVLSTLENNDIIFSTGGANTGDEIGRFQHGNGFAVSGPVYATGNVTAPYFIGNLIGNISGNLAVQGPNRGVVFNDDSIANSVTAFQFDKSSNLVTLTGNIDVQGMTLSGNLTANGNISGNYFLGNGYYLTGIITSVANINNGTSNVRIETANGNIQANVNGTANVITITDQGLILGNNVTANIKTESAPLWITPADGQYVSINSNNYAQLYWTSNIANLNPAGNDDYAWLYVNYTGVNIETNTQAGNQHSWIFRANGAIETSYDLISNANVYANYIESGTDVYAIANVTASGNVSGNYILGNGALLTGVITSVANINDGSSNLRIESSGGNILANVGGVANVFAITTDGANVSGNLGVTNKVTAAEFIGNANASSLASGTVPSARMSGTYGIDITGHANTANTVTDGVQSNITQVGTLSFLIVSGNISTTEEVQATGNVGAGNVNSLGNINATANISGANLISSGQVVVTGNVHASYFIGNGALLTGIDTTLIANGTSNVKIVSANGNATVNIDGTSNVAVFANTGLYVTGEANVTGSVNAANLVASANVSGNNVSASNAVTANTISATGNVSGGNLNTTGVVLATGNVSGGNLVTSGNVDATGNLAAGNISTGGSINATANVTALNFFANGAVSATTAITANGNITGANVLSNAAVIATGNVSGANITTTGAVDATGNITGGNITTAGLANVATLEATGNATAVGNLSGGNISTTGAVSATGNVTGGNLVTAGDAVIGGNLTVSGNTTYVNVTELNVEDPIIGLGRGANNTPLTVDDGKDRGTQLWYYSGSEKSAFVGYDNSGNRLIAATNVTITNELVTVNSYGNFQVGMLEAANANVTGNIDTSGIVASGNITANYYFGNAVNMTGIATASSVYSIINLQGNVTGNSTGNAVLIASNSSGNLQLQSGNGINMLGNAVTGNIVISIIGSTNDGTLWGAGGDAGLVTQGTTSITDNGLITDAVTSAYDLGVFEYGLAAGGTLTVGASAPPNPSIGDQWIDVVDGTLYLYFDDGSGSQWAQMASVYSIENGNPFGNVSANLLPAANASYDIGSSSLQWNNIYANNVIASGALTATGNVTGNYIFGNGALLTGVITSVANINSGSSNLRVTTSSGNIAANVGSSANVLVISDNGIYTTGLVSANNNIIINSFTGAPEGGQVVLGWKGVSGLTGQGNSTWNIDVNSANSFRVFYQDAAGSTGVPISIDTSVMTVSNVSITGNISGAGILNPFLLAGM
jgi:filamentous hemagglutinin